MSVESAAPPDWTETHLDRLKADLKGRLTTANLQGATYHLNADQLDGQTVGEWLQANYPYGVYNARFTDTTGRNPMIVYEPWTEPKPEEEVADDSSV